MSTEENIMQFQEEVEILAATAQLAAPIVSIFNPGIGAAIAALAPVAEKFVIGTSQLIIDFRKDMSPEEMIEALQASKSASWPTPSPITAQS